MIKRCFYENSFSPASETLPQLQPDLQMPGV